MEHATATSTEKLVIVKTNVPEKERNEFKAACAKDGRSMNDVLAYLMRRYAAGLDEKPQVS